MIDNLFNQNVFPPEDTSFVCDNCFLPYSKHNFGGGSMAQDNGRYICDRYDQRKQVKAKPKTENTNAASNNF